MLQQSDLLKEIVGMSCRLRILQDKTTGDTAKFIRYAISALNSAESVITHFADSVPAAPDDGVKYDDTKPRYDLIPGEITDLRNLAPEDRPDDELVLVSMRIFWLGESRPELFWRVLSAYRRMLSVLAGVQTDRGALAEALANVYAYGATKYGDRNWERGMAWGRVYSAWYRHYIRRTLYGEHLDPESNLPHMWHEAWNVMALYVYTRRRVGTDDRPCARRYEEGEGHD